MKALKGVIGGLVGGAIGAAIWAAVTIGTNHEIGWIAWGIGFLVGLGVKLGAGDGEGAGFGVIAACIALVSVGAGKFATVHYHVEKEMAAMTSGDVTDSDMIARTALEIVKETEAKGQPVQWPNGAPPEAPSAEKDFPKPIWAEAKSRWEAKPVADRQAQLAEAKRNQIEAIAMIKPLIRTEAFKASFSMFDLLWAFLAVGTAFRIGSGGGSSS